MCQALGHCRRAKKNEKVCERKTVGGRKGEPVRVSLNTSIRPLPRPPRVIISNVKISSVGEGIRASSSPCVQSFPRSPSKTFWDLLGHLSKTGQFCRKYVTCLATKVPRVSLFTVKFVGIFGFSVCRGGQITNHNFAAKKKLRITQDCSNEGNRDREWNFCRRKEADCCK